MGEILAFVLYFVAMLSVGIFFFVKSKSADEKEYFLGGREMGPWVTAMSAQASDMSAWLLMGLPGSIFAFGFGQAWVGIGLALGTIANWIFVAARLRRFSKAANDSITFPQYLSNRFITTNPALQIICAVIFLVFFTVYVASAFVAGTKVFTTVFPQLNEMVALVIFALIVIIYTFLGGFKAVCWTDFFQGLLMLVAVLAVPIVICIFFGGDLDASMIGKAYISNAGTAEEVKYLFEGSFFAASWKDIISGLAWGLGYFGMPHIIVRFMSIKKASMVKKSATVAIIWVILSLGAVILIAYLGRMLSVDGIPVVSTLLEGKGAQETIFIFLSRKLFPGFIAGLLMAAIIAASMSTADSQMLVASSSFTSDIYKPIFRKNASDKETLWVGRIVVIIVAVVAFFIASSKGSGASAIMDLVSNAWAGFGAAFGPVVILSLYWKRFTYAGAIAGIVSGGITVILWIMLFSASTGIYELLPGFIVCLVVSVLVSLCTKAPKQEVIELFERATDKSYDD